MNYRFFSPLILCGLLLISSQAISQKPSQKNIQIARLSQKELNSLAEKLAANGMHQYTHRVFTFDTKQIAKVEKERTVRGLFLLRKPDFMKPLHNGFFDDRRGNLIYFGHFTGKQNKDVSYAVTFSANGVVSLALDADSDGVMDGMLAKTLDGHFWSLSDNAAQALQQCFEGRAFFGAALCLMGGHAEQAGSRTGQPSKGGSTPGDPEDPNSLEAFINSLKEPDCDAVPTPGNTVTDLPPEKDVVKELLDVQLEAATLARQAEAEREARHEAAARDFEKAHNDLLAAHDALQRYTSTTITSRREDALDDYNDAHRDAEEAVRQAHRDHAMGGYLGPPPGSLIRPEHGPRPGSGTHKTPWPDEGEDPRCGLRDMEIKQGLWFMDKKFCPDRNFLDCWERSTDAIRDATEGRCHTETGKDDSRRVECDREQPHPTEPRDPDSPSGSADDPIRFPLAPGPTVDYKFSVPGPFGALLAVFCEQVDCEGMDKSKEAKPRPQP